MFVNASCLRLTGFRKNTDLYTSQCDYSLMSTEQMDTAGALPLVNGLGFVFGILGVVALFIQQSLAVFLPLLLPPTVCAIFCVLLYKTQQPSNSASAVSPNPVRIDII